MASVISERSGAVQRLQLNEPDSMNALSKTLSAERGRGVASAVADPDVRCILLTGTGRAFYAGGDIPLWTTGARARCAHPVAAHHSWVKQLLQGGKPVVTAINGLAAGAGFAVALFATLSLRLMRPDSAPPFLA
jgi:2-(1,2-epoxy-1,2-dihydrophenyl)acetyl-CoA isomerase